MSKIFTGEEAKLLVNLSYNLRYTIMDKNTSAAAVARKAGINPATLRSYIRGDVLADPIMIERLAAALDCAPEDLTKEYDYRMPCASED